MKFVSTRDRSKTVSASFALLNGISDDGGLFVPSYIPLIADKLETWEKLGYKDLAVEILSLYFEEFSKEVMIDMVDKAYNQKFLLREKVDIKTFERFNFLELYHGPTAAFKDMALCILAYLMKEASSMEKDTKEKIILTATSGDTGKAALEGFKDISPYKVIVFYPENGVSAIQKQQMVSSNAKNAYVVAVKGNFDDAQKGVKSLFADKELKEQLAQKNMAFSSANSINIGRLVPQIVYYFYGYLQMVNKERIKLGDKIDVSVPTGNFGNILAAYIAKLMGLPLDKLICASNSNKVLTDFIDKGVYDKNREFYQTSSPSMDILVSSNLERYIFLISKGDDKLLKNLMENLDKNGVYKISEQLKAQMKDLKASYYSDDEVLREINKVYKEHGYLMDPHTAIGYLAGKENSTGPILIASTASPYKFAKTVSKALNLVEESNEFRQMKALEKCTKKAIPNCLKDMEEKAVCQNLTIEVSQMKDTVKKILEV